MRDIPTNKWCERSACTSGLEATYTHRDNHKKYCRVCARNINEVNGEKLCAELKTTEMRSEFDTIVEKYNDSALYNALAAAGLEDSQVEEFVKEYRKWG